VAAAAALAAIVLLLPALPVLKEWAYAGVTFALVMAFISAYTGGEGVQTWGLPPVLLALLLVSYVTRPAGRRQPCSPSRDRRLRAVHRTVVAVPSQRLLRRSLEALGCRGVYRRWCGKAGR
jgi:hypothetical protein